VAQAGISGSTILGDQVVLAGQAGIAGHLHIGAGSRIGAQAGVMADVSPRSDMVGSPAQPVKAFFKEVATIRRWIRNGGIPVQTSGSREKSNPDVD
jgi:UDP-3-O-[3-hydroxymyristoyl] glucosamine N-acyltransferase